MENAPEIDAATWQQEVLKSEKLTLIYFWHEQCPWCMRLNPVLSEIAEEYSGRIKFVKLNVLESPTKNWRRTMEL